MAKGDRPGNPPKKWHVISSAVGISLMIAGVILMATDHIVPGATILIMGCVPTLAAMVGRVRQSMGRG